VAAAPGQLGRPERPGFSTVLRTAGGVLALVLLGGCAGPRAPEAAVRPARLPSALADTIIEGALRGIERHLNMPAPYCLSIQSGDSRTEPDGAWLSRITLEHQVLAERACPLTYGSMVRMVDSLGRDVGPVRPPEYIDPYHVQITPPVAITRERAVVRLQASQGTHGWLLYCEVNIAAPQAATCGPTAQWDS
jgi:hypothetical protein